MALMMDELLVDTGQGGGENPDEQLDTPGGCDTPDEESDGELLTAPLTSKVGMMTSHPHSRGNSVESQAVMTT